MRDPAAVIHHAGSSGAALASDMAGSASQVRAEVRRVRDRLERVLRGRALLMALASGCAVSTAAALLVLQRAIRVDSLTAAALALLSGVVAGTFSWWRVRARHPDISLVRAALWLEERAPSAHALVTLVEHAPGALAADTERRLAHRAQVSPHAASVWLQQLQRQQWRGPGVLAGALLLVMLATLRVSMATDRSRASNATAGRETRAMTRTTAPTAATSRLTPWRVQVIPPAYSRKAARTLVDSATVQALPGSRIRLSGAGALEGLRAEWLRPRDSTDASQTVLLRADGVQWVLDVVMPSRVSAVRVRDDVTGTDRVLALVPQPDSLPQVQLLAPAEDVVQRDSTGALLLQADARDDLGLAALRFELIVTSGAGERYTARTVVLGERQLNGTRRDSLTVRTTLESLGLVAGDIVHVRAVARDRHPASNREFGVSETRSLRIARADEYDSVAVDAAPPPAVDSSMLSQRMLLLLTERLDARRPRISREVLVSESRRLASEQARIRRAVSAIVFQRLSGDGESEHVHYEGDGHDHGLTVQAGKLVPSSGASSLPVMPGATPPPGLPASMSADGGESPIVGINRPLLEAYNHMWDAGRALELADPSAAIPPMRLALDAIQRARAAERVYLRGRTRPIVVDLARVRLAGRDTGQASRRRPGEAVSRTRLVWDARLRRAAMLLATDAAAARDSLLTLRLDALGTDAAFAESLETVLQAASRGEDATAALVRARRLLSPPQRTAPSSWGTP
jgi:hypothetical protein